MIYFDNGSTTKISEPVYEKLCDFLKNNFANPSSLHSIGFEAEKELIENGYSVINPAKVNAMLPEDATWEEYIKVSLTLLSICTGVYMMPGWRESRGAVLEFMQARRNGMQIYEDIPGRLQN